MKFELLYAEEVKKKDIPKLSVEVREIVKLAIEAKLLFEPEKYGKPLRRSLRGYRKLRVGDYRVIFRIEGVGGKKGEGVAAVKIFAILHRSIVYKYAKSRVL